MRLRRWQSECIDKALVQFRKTNHFFCQATPGAGKTRMTAELAKILLADNQIDLIMCFAPSKQVVEGFKSTFGATLNQRLDGMLGAIGNAITYQSLEHKGPAFWRVFEQYRVLAVFDEIHHCAGSNGDKPANTWGEKIVSEIQNLATYTIALSGTPWRTDKKSIALAKYSTPEGKIIVDYQYTLKAAINEQACRTPELTLIDNNKIQVEQLSDSPEVYAGIARALESEKITFLDLATNGDFNLEILKLANKKLNNIRNSIPDSAGLIVAANIHHAHRLSQLLAELNEPATVVTNLNSDASTQIDRFRKGHSKWIIAVGMISEGTDIPRLQVCCYLSHTRTELYFRQVLGRILRRRGEADHTAWLYMLAEPELSTFAERLMEDLPQDMGALKNIESESNGINVEIIDKEERNDTDNCTFSNTLHTTQENGISVYLGNEFAPEDMLYNLTISGTYHEKLLAYF